MSAPRTKDRDRREGPDGAGTKTADEEECEMLGSPERVQSVASRS